MVTRLFAISFPHMFGFWNFNAGFVVPVDALTLKCCLCKELAENAFLLMDCLLFPPLSQGS